MIPLRPSTKIAPTVSFDSLSNFNSTQHTFYKRTPAKSILLILIPPIFFVLKMLSAFYVCYIFSSAIQTRFYYGGQHYGLIRLLLRYESDLGSVKPVLSDHSADDPKIGFHDR